MLDKIKYRITVLKKLLPFSSGVKRFFALSLLVSVITMVLGFITPLFYKMFIQNVVLNGDIKLMIWVVIGYISILVVNTLLGYIKNYSNNRMINRVTFRSKLKIWRHLFKEDFTSYENMSIGDTKMRLEDDISCIGDYADTQTISYLINYVTLIVALVLMFVIQWELTLFAIAMIPITFILNHIISKREWKMQDANRENDQKQSSWLNTSIHGWREVRALNLQKHEEREFIRYNHKFANYFIPWNNYWVTRVLVIPKIKNTFILQFALYFIGGLLIMANQLSIGNLLVFAVYYNMLSGAVNTVSQNDADLQSNRFKSDRLVTELEKTEIVSDRKNLIPDDSNEIIFTDVRFTYPNSDNEVIHKLSLVISKGERVAITGKSGIGKTTVLKLITGMVTPTSGSVLFGNVNLKDIDMAAMHKRIGFVMQENMLFNDTIRENLLYGKENATDNELVEACKKAYINDFINNLPDGFDTIIGERGIKLSGGQRQRIVLARLFLRNVQVFIFDEATSALDQYSENIVHDAIRSIAEDKTIIVVAHRASSISLCDRKIEMDKL